MVRATLYATFAALLAAAPVQAETSVGDVVGGIARQYLEQEQDRAAFAQAARDNTLSAYQVYLRQFPKGAYAEQAREQVRRLGGTADSQTADAASGLSGQQRVQIQRRLNALGYSTNGTDGAFGPGTRRAIALWQRDRNYAQTGTLSPAQASEILRGTTAGAPAPTASEVKGTRDGVVQSEAALNLTRQQRSAIQAGLTRRGFDTRGVDGVFGRGTRNAIAAWQRANDLPATGYLTAAEAQRLISG